MNPQRLLRNSFFMTGGVLAGGVVLFAVFVLIARYLPVERFGQFVVVLTVASIFQLFADGGIVNVTVRDLVQTAGDRARLFGSTRALVWMFTLALGGVIALVTELWAPDAAVRATAWAMGAAALMALHGLLYSAVVRAHEDMGTVAMANLWHKLLLLALVVAAIQLDTGVEGVAIAHALANLAQWLFFAVLVRRHYLKAPLRVDLAHWRYLVVEAVPLGLGQVLRRMTTHLGTFLLTALAGVVAVGLYNSAFRVVQMIEIGAVAATGVLLPVFSRLAKGDGAMFSRLYDDAFRIMVVLASAVGGLLMAYGDALVLVIYGAQYAEAGPALRVLGASLCFLMPSAVMHAVFTAIGRQTMFMKLAVLGVLSSATLGILLIPKFGSLGAAMAATATEIALFIAGALYLRGQGLRARYVGIYLRVLALTAVLVAAGDWSTAWLRSTPALALACVAFLLAYALLIVGTRVITRGELAYMRGAMRPGKPPPAA